MSNDEISSVIANIERELAAEDPAFLRRLRTVERRDAFHVTVVFLLLAAGAVLLTVGLSTFSAVAWYLGASALVASVLVDAAYQCRLRRRR